VIIIALFVLARWPLSLYAGVLRGLQLQVAQNTISVVATILRVGAGVAVAFIAPSTILFLLSQAIGGFIEVLALAVGAWWALGVGGGERSPFKAVVRGIWRFALSFNVIGFLSVVVIVSGQLIMSRFLPLVEVGFYSVAVSAASAVGYIPTAVAWAVFPRFSGLHETRALDELSETFRVSAHTTVFFGIGVALPVALFSHTLLLFWLRSPAVANGAAGATSLLALGYLMYAVWAVPQYLVISSGATRKPLLMTLVVVPTALVIETALVAEHGILVGGWTWLIVSAIFSATYGLLSVQLIPSAGIRGFWVRSVGPTVLAGLATFGGARLLAQALDVANSIIPVILGGIAYALLGYRTLPASVRETAMKPVSRLLGRLPSVAGGP
jgi:O-antigen/teichoic acid export membrane protein